MRHIILTSAAFALAAAGPVHAHAVLHAPPAATDQAAAPAPSPADAFARFRALRAEAVQAANAGDLDAAAARLAEADALIVNHPGMILLRARIAAMAGDGAAAVAHMDRYGRAGLYANVAGDAALSSVADTPGFAEAAARIAANRAPVGADRLVVVARVDGGGLAESVVRQEGQSRWLVAQVAGRTILSIDDAGAVTPFLAEGAATGGLLGLAIDEARGWLWAASAPVPPAAHGLEGTPLPATALLRIELASGRIDAAFGAPDDGLEHGFGDLVLGPDGTVYVADAAGGVYRLAPGAEGLDAALAAGTLSSPQGMALTPDGTGLIIADYSTGLHRVDLASGRLEALPQPGEASLIGIDGLASDGTAIYALQNGVAPQRVLKLTLSADWRRIETVEVLAAGLPELDQPTTGLVHGGELVFVSRSQWSDFGPDGAPRSADPAPAAIARLRLD